MRRRGMELRRPLAPAVLAALLAVGCRSPERRWPFPEVPAADAEAVAAVLRERTAGVRSLYAELTMSFEGRERGGVFAAVVHYHRGSIRMTAFKDVLVASRGVFDLLLAGGRFVLVLEGEEGPERHEGPARELPAVHPGFRAIAALGEAMFLPGLVQGDGVPAVRRAGGRLLASGPAPSGHEVEWILDPRTLGVEGARLAFAGDPEPATVAYTSYRAEGGVYIPERFALADPGAGVAIEGVLDDLEVNPEVDPALFDPGTLEKGRGR